MFICSLLFPDFCRCRRGSELFDKLPCLVTSPSRSFYRDSCLLAFVLPSLYPAYECTCSFCQQLYVTAEKKIIDGNLIKKNFLSRSLFLSVSFCCGSLVDVLCSFQTHVPNGTVPSRSFSLIHFV